MTPTPDPDIRPLFFLNIVRDGAGMINRELGYAGELRRRGYAVHILSYFQAQDSLIPEGVSCSELVPSKYRALFYRRLVVFPYVLVKLFMALRRFRPTHVFVDLPNEAWWALLLKPVFGYEVVFTYHGVADSRFYSGNAARELDRVRAYGHAMLRKVDRVWVVSDFLLQETDRLGIQAKRLHNGVDLERCSPQRRIENLHTENPIVLFVGRYTEYKGALNVVKAFIQTWASVPDAMLLMRGYFERPDYEAEIRTAVREAGLEHRILMFGPVEGGEMMYWVNMATVFINGSVDETFCMPLLEAQACGIPCVAFAAGGIPEVVLHGQTGWLAAPGDVGEMATYLTRLLSTPAQHAEFAAYAQEHAAGFRYAALTDEWEKLLKE